MAILIWLFTIFCCTLAHPFIDDDIASVKVNPDELFLQIHTRKDPIGARVNVNEGANVASLSSFDVNLKTYIYVHGWKDKISNPLTLLVKQSLLDASDANVLLFHWDKCAANLIYLVSWKCVEGTGNYLGEFLNDIQKSYGYSLSNVTIIGHSLGAHIAGYAGKTTNGNLDVIVGLDPAGPLFGQGDKEHRLTETDAQYVQAIHTCATGIVGVTYSLGDSDFWPNSGSGQPGCGLDVLQCPHMRAIYYYAESLSSDGFVSWNCNSYNDYTNGNCNNVNTTIMGGLNIDKTARGNYYLDTNDKSPFAKGGF